MRSEMETPAMNIRGNGTLPSKPWLELLQGSSETVCEVISLAIYRAAHKLVEPPPTLAYLKMLLDEVLAERAVGAVSPDLRAECERVLLQCGRTVR